MKKIWSYYSLLTSLLLTYTIFVIVNNPDEPSFYVICIFTISCLLIYPLISLLAGFLLLMIVKDWKKRIISILFSLPLFLTASVAMIGILVTWKKENKLLLSIEGGAILSLEAIILQLLIVGVNILLRKVNENHS